MDRNTISLSRSIAAAGLIVAGLFAWPAIASAGASGDAVAARATVLGLFGSGTTVSLADTGTLSSSSDARDASQLSGGLLSVLNADALYASTVGSPDGSVASEASLADAGVSIAGNTLGVGFAMAQVNAPAGSAPVGVADVEGLVINGTSIVVTGQPNQVIPLPVGYVVVNEQTVAADGSMVVNAIHVVVTGVADVVIASATAGSQSATVTSPLLPPLLGSVPATPGDARVAYEPKRLQRASTHRSLAVKEV